MKAVRIHEYGGPEVLKYEDIEVPVPKANEVLVRVKACALNHLDLWIRQGMPKVKTLPHILGSDNAGEVTARRRAMLARQTRTTRAARARA